MAVQRRFFSLSFLLSIACAGAPIFAQNAQTTPAPQTSKPAASQTTDVEQLVPVPEKPDPLKRRLSDGDQRQQQKDLSKEIKGEYKKWLDEDVRWIITDEELAAFKHLTNDEERDKFEEAFWQRRNPNQDSPDNEFMDEHYRRIAFANDHYAAGEPGWKTDRGMMYIKFGKPDSIDSQPSGGEYNRPMEEGGGQTVTYPFEIWHYRYIPGVGDNVDIEFVDACMCNEYRATIDRSEKDALKHTPGMGPTMWEEQGKAKPEDRLNGSLEQLGTGPESNINQSKEFDRLERFTKLMAPPEVKYKDLEAYLVTSKILSGPPFPMLVRADYVKVTDETVLVPITLQIQNKEITFTTKDGVATGKVEIEGRVTSIAGKVIRPIEDVMTKQVPAELLDNLKLQSSLYWYSIPLSPGRYRVDFVIKDVNRPDHIGHRFFSIDVPRYDDDKLDSSSLILADQMYNVPSKDIGQGSFVIGNTHVQPRVSASPAIPVSFNRGQVLNFWMQVYNLGIDDKKKQNDATIEYLITESASNKVVLDMTEATSKPETQSSATKFSQNADQLTLAKSLKLASLQPGKYQLTIKVNDGISKQQIAPSQTFEVD